MTRPYDPALEEQIVETVGYFFTPTRRQFVQALGAGLLIAVLESPLRAQVPGRPGRGPRGGGAAGTSARLHIGKDGTLTILTGKVEAGQGSRAEITQAAAEELHIAPDRIVLLMADTAEVPDDGMTAGSGTTPRTVPAVRQAAAAARELLLAAAAQRWNVKSSQLEVRDGKAIDAATKRELSYADLATADPTAFSQAAPPNVTITAVKDWKALGTPLPRPNGHDLVTGAHKYPSDITHPGMLHGKILRAPSYGAKLTAIDIAPAKAIKDVVVVHDGNFVGVAAPTSFQADQALEALDATAKWDAADHPSSDELFTYLAKHAREAPKNPFADELPKAAKTLKQTYEVAYAQHAPMEPRAACALWESGKLTVWTGTQNPFGVRGELARAFQLSEDSVRVIVPDFGGGFGGKHTGECAVEAARLAQAAGKPVTLRWTRREEFTWAYFRPAAAITAEATLDAANTITSWHFADINGGSPGIETPYRIAKARSQAIASDAPLRQGSYRALGSTGNNFARECFMDELAALAGLDPLAFRLAHLEPGRLRAVLEDVAKRADFLERRKGDKPGIGVGLSCGTEKGSFVAACAEVAVADNTIRVTHVWQTFECGAITNPSNLLAQVQGAIVMGLGPALREGMTFDKGSITNANFAGYKVPRFADVPELDIHLLDRPDLASTGAGETPIIAIAPAVANAVFHATGKRLRAMPLRFPDVK